MAQRPIRLTATQKRLLRKHYAYYRELDCGSRCPVNATEEHFVAVCRGLAEPITEHEVAYARFKRHLAMRGLPVEKVERAGFEPIPNSVCPPRAVPEARPQNRLVGGEPLSKREKQVESEAFERYGREASDPPPGYIYRDNRYGNRRWNA